MTGEVPFITYRNDAAVIVAVTMRHERPERPNDVLVTDSLWTLWTSCWTTKAIDRPSMTQALAQMQEETHTDDH